MEVDEAVHPLALVGLDRVAAVHKVQHKGTHAVTPVAQHLIWPHVQHLLIKDGIVIY